MMETAKTHNAPLMGSIELSGHNAGQNVQKLIDIKNGDYDALVQTIRAQDARINELTAENAIVHQRCMDLEKQLWAISHKLIDVSSML